jgi:hypothetical protein
MSKILLFGYILQNGYQKTLFFVLTDVESVKEVAEKLTEKS